MTRIIVYVRGGNVQGIIADAPGVQYMLVDYDNEAEGPPLDRQFFDVDRDPDLFARTEAGAECDEP